MAVLCKLSRFLKRSHVLNKNVLNAFNNARLIRTVADQPKPKSIVKLSLIGASVGALVGAGYSFNKINQDRKNIAIEGTQAGIEVLKHKPPVEVSRKVVSAVDNTGLKLTLFQYQTCPFCCKVRVFLDYYGISYDVVEVDAVMRSQIKWSPYKKVPILLAKVDGGYQPLNDSTMIISLIASVLSDRSHKIDELAKYYPNIAYHDEKGVFKQEIVNKYFLMYQNNLPKDKTMNDIVEERKWRKWVDDVLVHVLSPNVYRSLDESFQAFNWFSEVGKWDEYFPSWERSIMVNVGASAMWLISKRLKKRHQLKEDVRQSLYEEINHWLNAVRARGTPFMGGQNPDLSDLAVYGILKSIEGCDAFKDLLKHTKLSEWFYAVQDKVDKHSGSVQLNH